jgi:hypothetical protein
MNHNTINDRRIINNAMATQSEKEDQSKEKEMQFKAKTNPKA